MGKNKDNNIMLGSIFHLPLLYWISTHHLILTEKIAHYLFQIVFQSGIGPYFQVITIIQNCVIATNKLGGIIF